MIKTIEIQNFQSHDHSVLDLDPGVNVITGSSDSGKSAIIRALIWLVRNDPIGFAFRSIFAEKDEPTEVAINLDDAWVTRERTPQINRYNVSWVEDPLEAFGTGVPEEVASALNLSDYSIQGQHDGYFLLQATAGEVARELNKIAGLDIIDQVSKRINSIVQKARSGLDNADEQIATVQEELKEFDYLPGLQKKINRLEWLLNTRDRAKEERAVLFDLSFRIQNLDREISEFDAWLEIEKAAKSLIEEGDRINAVMREKNNLEDLVRRIESVNGEIRDLEVDAENHGKVLQLIEDCRDAYWIRDEMRKLRQLLLDIDNLDEVIWRLETEDISPLEKERKQMGLFCPQCGYRFDG